MFTATRSNESEKGPVPLLAGIRGSAIRVFFIHEESDGRRFYRSRIVRGDIYRALGRLAREVRRESFGWFSAGAVYELDSVIGTGDECAVSCYDDERPLSPPSCGVRCRRLDSPARGWVKVRIAGRFGSGTIPEIRRADDPQAEEVEA